MAVAQAHRVHRVIRVLKELMVRMEHRVPKEHKALQEKAAAVKVLSILIHYQARAKKVSPTNTMEDYSGMKQPLKIGEDG